MTYQEVEIGQVLKDGWVVAGISPDTKDVFSIEPKSLAPAEKESWLAGMARGLKLSCEGHKDARLPSLAELKVIFNNRASLGYAELSHPNQKASASMDDWSGAGTLTGAYWSSTLRPNKKLAIAVSMSADNHYGWDKQKADHYARCVRSEPNLKLK